MLENQIDLVNRGQLIKHHMGLIDVNNPAKIRVKSDNAGTTVKVNGFYIRTLARS